MRYKLCKTTKGNYPLDSFLLFVEMPLCRLLPHGFSPPFAPQQPLSRGVLSRGRRFPVPSGQTHIPGSAHSTAQHASLTVQQHCVRLVQTTCSTRIKPHGRLGAVSFILLWNYAHHAAKNMLSDPNGPPSNNCLGDQRRV